MITRLKGALSALTPAQASLTLTVGTFVSVIAALALLWYFRRRNRRV